jgi:hypothetical protein
MKKLLGALIVGFTTTVSACSTTEQPVKEVEKQVKAPVSKMPCKPSMSPPIKDKSKLKVLLEKQGRITSDMTPAQVDKTINDYIRKKRAAYKSCQKKG